MINLYECASEHILIILIKNVFNFNERFRKKIILFVNTQCSFTFFKINICLCFTSRAFTSQSFSIPNWKMTNII